MKFPTRFAVPLVPLGVALAFATMAFRGHAAASPDPGATEANITRLTTGLLEHSQFAHHPFDDALASTLLDRYLDSLDGSRSLFLQTDVDEFATYRATLAQTTRTGDTRAAQAIFARYLQRLEERLSYVTGALGTETFDFTGHDAYSLDREQAPRPRDLAAAKGLWRQQLRAEYLQEKLSDKPKDQIARTLTLRNTRQVGTMKALRSDEVLAVYLDALAHVYDPHSDYLGHEEMESFSIAMNLSLFGIGATLESADGYCKIRELVPGGPAARSGLLKAGDRITAVAQAGKEPVDIVNMPLSHAVELIRGPKGSTVTLTVIPAGAADSALPKTESIVRDQVKLEDQEANARIVEMPTGNGAVLRLGVIDLPSFYADMGEHEGAGGRSATADVALLLSKLKAENVRGVVLDLRRNGGGSLKEAITLSGLFIRKGPVVQTRDQAGNVEVDVDPDPSVLYDGPLVLLTSRFSASASEILAGALQDYGRALIVGDTSTFGKGTVQNVVPLARVMDQAHLEHSYDPGALKITTNKFYRPSGASTQLRGVASDIVLPSISDISGVSESAMKDPLPWDVVPPLPLERLNRVEPYVSALREKSLRRVNAEKDFRNLTDDIARAKKSMAAKSISLNEADRRRELAEDKARRALRESEHRALHVSQPTTYEITLKNANAPGLPPPTALTNAAGTSDAPASTTDDLAKTHERRSDDILLNESERVLSDYVDLLARQRR
jgi:carboxyl-terminal processing protease